MATIRLAVDVGGTFTDTILTDGEHVIASSKTLTTHADPATGTLQGVQRALQASGLTLADVTGFVHGTTLATNALIERRGAKTATITTEGFRDILDIAYERRYSQYDINIEKPELIVPRTRSFTIRERLRVDGHVLQPLDTTQIDTLVASLEGCEAVAICLLHAYANPAHEQQLRDELLQARPDLCISLSSEVSPEAREFDRLCTTGANAYIQPLMQGYLQRFSQTFTEQGLRCSILMMTASGGMCTLATAARYPIRLVESGPAGGAILAARVAAACELEQVLSFDMGGTTAKLCLIDQAQPQSSRQFEIARAARFIKGSGMPVRIPVIDMIEIGAGGGSIASVDHLGRLVVGPRSAGSEPGPVAFARGGADATVTDADATMGYLRAEDFAEGQFSLDAMAAQAALAAQIGTPLQLDAQQAALGVSRIVDESMASAARMHAVESGKDLATRTMIAFGGNGPLHACRVARAAGIRHILIPCDPGVGSAVGFLYAPVSFETVRSRYSLLDTLDCAAISTLLEQMQDEARSVVRQGSQAPLNTTRSAFMRYHGQGHEIEIPLPNGTLKEIDIANLRALFESAYSQQFSRPVPGMHIEILNWAVRVASPAPSTTAPTTLQHPGPLTGPRTGQKISAQTRPIFCDVNARTVEALYVERRQLRPGDSFQGPALVHEAQTSTLVASDFSAWVDAYGHLILEAKP